jgi:hypothetical protein
MKLRTNVKAGPSKSIRIRATEKGSVTEVKALK